MKKEYITPEILLRRVILESFIADSIPTGTGSGSWGGGDARDNSNWDDEEENGNIWED